MKLKNNFSETNNISVFKTNVQTKKRAEDITKEIEKNFQEYTVSFDIDDCDRILRIESKLNIVGTKTLIEKLNYLNVKVSEVE